MMQPIQQIHHISAIVGDPQVNVDFYREVLGLRLVKQTVNFDDPYTYHLYYSNLSIENGTIITFSHGPMLILVVSVADRWARLPFAFLKAAATIGNNNWPIIKSLFMRAICLGNQHWNFKILMNCLWR